MDVRIAAYVVIISNGALLLTHWNEDGRSGWTLPGGGLEYYETAEQAAIREAMEETGLAVELTGLLGVDSLYVEPANRAHGRTLPLHSFRVLYRARVVGGTLTNEVAGSSDEARWVTWEELADLPVLSLVGVALDLWPEPTAGGPTGHSTD